MDSSPRPQNPDAGCRFRTPLQVGDFRDFKFFQILQLQEHALLGIAQVQNPL
jgi:hypothetical protein